MSHLIGKAVRNERRTRGLTQQELGELAETGLNFISQLERGKLTVRLDKTLAVMRVLGLELQVIRGKRGVSVSATLSPDLANEPSQAPGDE